MDFVVDRSTLKQGRFTPGNRLAVLPPDTLLERRADYVLLLTLNFAAEILTQQREFRRMGGKFIVLVPEIKRGLSCMRQGEYHPLVAQGLIDIVYRPNS